MTINQTEAEERRHLDATLARIRQAVEMLDGQSVRDEIVGAKKRKLH